MRAGAQSRTKGSVPSFTPVQSGLLQRKCACGGAPGVGGECAACRKKRLGLQRKANGLGVNQVVPRIVHEVLGSPGQPLGEEIRTSMEPRFGHDFSRVRVHTGGKAAESAEAVGALAYTVGRHVVFGAGRFAPATSAGRQLLAHELSHVKQQGNGEPHADLELGRVDSSLEREADQAAESVALGGRVSDLSRTAERPVVRRAVEPMPERLPSTERLQQEAPTPGCNPAPGIPNTNCSAYWRNAWWLPLAYVNNATCACQETPNTPTAKCVRKVLQDRLDATPWYVQAAAAALKSHEINPVTYPAYQLAVQALLTPRIYDDHVLAYKSCCCPSGPANYAAWIGVTSVRLPCYIVGYAIRQFGSCHGTPGRW